MPSDNRDTWRKISPSEADRALYIDFEGLQNDAPSLMGVLGPDGFSQVVLDPALRSAAEAKDLVSTTGTDALKGLLEQASVEGRRICAFSEHELWAAREYFGVDLSPAYANGRAVLKRWWNRFHPCPRPESWCQAEFERCLGLEREGHLGEGLAAKRLRHVRDQLVRRGDFASLTPTAKGKWTKLLAYNQLDVEHLAVMVRRAASDVGDTTTGRVA